MDAGMLLLIDGDSIAYRAAAAAETRFWDVVVDGFVQETFQYKKDAQAFVEEQNYLDDDLVQFVLRKEPEDVVNALHNVKSILAGILDISPMYRLYLSSNENYRDDIATIKPYKGNREGVEKPFHLEACRQYMVEHWDAEICIGYEADDALSMNQNADTCIVTIDKDLDTVAGKHFNWVKNELYTLTKEDARTFFYTQMLTGDTVDNIPGVPKIGPKKAEKILSDAENERCAVGLQYAIAYDDPEAAFEENARLLWMSRKEPNDWSWEVFK